MRSGVLQQVASPKELYETPVNLFVAGFIGSPSMNFLSGTMEDGKLRTSLGDFAMSDRLRREVEAEGSGRQVIVGVRPENFEDASFVSPSHRSDGITFHANIDVLESLGSDVFVYFTHGSDQGVTSAELEELARDSGRGDTSGSGDTIVARLDAETQIREGHDAELWVDGRSIHVFDPASGKNLSLAVRGEDGAAVIRSAAPSADTAEGAGGQSAATGTGSGEPVSGAGSTGPTGEAT
jgi:multiple sugar transport system ATP-binding protein